MQAYVSIIIPCYNSEDTIERALASVVQQTYQAFDIIIVDDGSTDKTHKRIATFFEKHPSIKYRYLYQENKGPASARNAGLREAKGDFIAFLDGDDMWHPQKLELCMAVMQSHTIDFLGHGFSLENNFSTSFSAISLKKIDFLKLLLKNFAVTPSVVLKKEVCELFNERMRFVEDHELWLRIALKTDVYYMDLPLTMLGRKPLSLGGLSANRWAMRKGELYMYGQIVSYKKSLIPVYPLLVFFSLFKHLRHVLKNFIH